MKKYKLILSIDNEPIEAIITGNLEDIDNYIFKNNINNSVDLFNSINIDNKYNERKGIYKFEIYSMERPVKTVELLYKENIEKFKTKYNQLYKLENDLFEKFKNDKEFNKQFFVKFVNPLTKMPDKITSDGRTIVNENRIKAWQLINFQDIYDDFINYSNFNTKDINEKIDLKKEKIKYDIIYENKFSDFCHSIMAIKNNKTHKYKMIYDEARSFYAFYKFFNQQKSINTINNIPQNENTETKKLN